MQYLTLKCKQKLRSPDNLGKTLKMEKVLPNKTSKQTSKQERTSENMNNARSRRELWENHNENPQKLRET